MVQEIINEQVSVESSHPQLTAVNLGGIGGKSGLEAVLSPLASERTVGFLAAIKPRSIKSYSIP